MNLVLDVATDAQRRRIACHTPHKPCKCLDCVGPQYQRWRCRQVVTSLARPAAVGRRCWRGRTVRAWQWTIPPICSRSRVRISRLRSPAAWNPSTPRHSRSTCRTMPRRLSSASVSCITSGSPNTVWRCCVSFTGWRGPQGTTSVSSGVIPPVLTKVTGGIFLSDTHNVWHSAQRSPPCGFRSTAASVPACSRLSRSRF